MSHSWRSPTTVESLGKILSFPVPQNTGLQPELPGALTYGSAENLIHEAAHLLMRVIRLAHSLSKDERLTVLGDLLAIQVTRLDPLQMYVERQRAVLSDVSAKAAKNNRRRKKRVRRQLTLEDQHRQEYIA